MSEITKPIILDETGQAAVQALLEIVKILTGSAVTIKGADGIDVTHSWDGTVLNVTSASGTSSADLKGDKGDTGASGVYIGTGTPPEGANVWINPDGDPTSTEDWEFDLDDGTIDTKTVVVVGSDEAVANGQLAFLKMKQEDGTWVEIPAIVGSKGDKGDKGDKGEKGDTGAQGAQGVQGLQGLKGDTGAAGSNGKDGSNGVSCTHSWNGTTLTITSASGTSSADLKGSKGDKGDKGDTGATGATGQQGEKGEKGDKGDKGDTGAAGSDAAVTASNIATALGYTPANKADIATTAMQGTASQSNTYWKIYNFGNWGTGNWTQKGFSMLITSRAGEMIWLSLAANDSNTSAGAIRLINRYSKIAALHYSVSENAIYVTAAAWANNICAHVLSNVNGDYVPAVSSASALPADAVAINIVEFGVTSTSAVVGDSSVLLEMGGSADRPTYNGSNMALQSDIPALPSTENWTFTLEDGSTVTKAVHIG